MKFKDIEKAVLNAQRIEHLKGMYEQLNKACDVLNIAPSLQGEDGEFYKAAEEIRGMVRDLQQAIYRRREQVENEHRDEMWKFYEETGESHE